VIALAAVAVLMATFGAGVAIAELVWRQRAGRWRVPCPDCAGWGVSAGEGCRRCGE
jgi:DnaJ-class molecular chaperone